MKPVHTSAQASTAQAQNTEMHSVQSKHHKRHSDPMFAVKAKQDKMFYRENKGVPVPNTLGNSL